MSIFASLLGPSSASGGFNWIDQTTGTATLVPGTGYITDLAGGVTYTLPATATIGSAFQIVGKTGLWTIAQNANQQILLGAQATTVGTSGSLSSTSHNDSVELVCITGGSSTVWRVIDAQGALTVV